MNFFTILPLLCFFLLSSPAKASDLQNLLSFKASLPNPNPPQLHNWQKNTHPCSFYGVSCNNKSRVGSLDLTSVSLSVDVTSVAAHLLQLEQLTSLHLKSANLSGPIELKPDPFCSTSLAEIDLSENLISGPFSDLSSFRVCSGLKRLNLSSNLLDVSRDLLGTEKIELSVETLDVSSNKLLSGDEILPWILSGGCDNLQYLSLKGNKLTGTFSLSGCTHLSYLDISANNFSIPIPNLGSDCPNLQHLDFSSNRFSGQIGEAFLGLKMLKYLNMSNNLLTGDFDLPSLPSLEFLYLGNNHLQGVLPEGFADAACSTLLEIDLSFNNFSGMIPTGFGSCSSLEKFDISSNNFTGDLPMDVFLRMGKLRKLGLGFNHFVGILPDSVSTMTDLEVLDLSSNGVSGKIPGKVCGSNLKELYLQNNLLTGIIPPSLGNCSKLVSLDLSFNQLNGIIPGSLGNLANLKDLIMWMNQLEGDIPSELMYNRKLETLILDYNKLTGTIPAGLSNCTNLNWISLSSNMLSGEIPSWIGSLANLAILKLSNNSFHGNIPMELGDCKSLLWLDLNSNMLSGNIPYTLSKQSGFMAVGLVVGRKYVYLRNDGSKDCRGTGNLLEFAGIRQEALDRIPTRNTCNFTRIYKGNTQPTFNHNDTMIFLDLSYNNLEGSIPKELGSMAYLSILNLGHNILSGSIPQELGGLKSIGVLDLSHNHLSGQIPSSLAGLTLLTEIDLSFNELTGVIPESGQFETFPAYRFYNNSGLCGYPLPSCDKNSTSNASHRQSHKRQTSLVRSVAMGLLFSLFCIFSLFVVYTEMKKRKKLKESSLDIYTNDGNSQSVTHSAWRFTSHQEALSINLSTFVNPLRRLTFADLLEATNGFNDNSIIGKGGFGDVYKARLKDGTFVAIKKLIHIGQGDREFTAEMETIGKIKHRNLVPLLGYCKVGDERLLVYEYMKHGSLDDVLHSQKKGGIKLNWSKRRNIAMGAARGLAFLHHSCIPHIIHRDMKSSNVLVDENLEARVSDFGMARLMSAMDTHLSVSTLAGTPGYVPPEYYQSFQCSTKGDVYSYGVVLLELLTGKQPTNSIDFGDNNNLVSWVKLHAKLRVTDVFDKELVKEDSNLVVELLEHLKVACACLDDRPWKRPTMIQVMAMFKEIQAGSGLDNSGSTDERRLSSTIDIIDHMSLTEIPEEKHKL